MALLSLAALHAQAERLLGFVRDADTQRYLYTEVHELVPGPDGAVQTGVTTYYDAQGREIARKTLDYRANRTVPVYRLDMPAQKYSEGIEANKPQALLFKLDKGKEERKAMALDGGLVAADSGFNQLLLDQWPRLQAGERVTFGLIVAGNTDRYRFRARKTGDTTVAGQAAASVLVEPDSMLRLLVDPIELVYDAKGSKLLAYKGLSNIIDAATGKVFKKVSITYGGPAPAEAIWPGSK